MTRPGYPTRRRVSAPVASAGPSFPWGPVLGVAALSGFVVAVAVFIAQLMNHATAALTQAVTG